MGVIDRLTGWLRVRLFLARTNAPPWRCAECGAANHAGTLECCHGCGDRGLLEAIEPRASQATVARHARGAR